MAADSSINETEAGAAAGEEKPLREAPAGPPRPPRPAQRTPGSLRIPLPSSITPGARLNGAARVDLAPKTPVPANSNSASIATEEVTTEIATASATPVPAARGSTRPPAAVITPEVPGDATTNYEFPLTRRSSAAPPLSFDSQDVDPSDRAPIAPLTPWRDVPPLKEPVLDRPRPAANEDHEDTIVGQVPKNLLELSSEEDENTRAYQAPQELIDLARRQREERQQATGGSGQKGKRAISPTSEERDQNEIRTATVPVDTIPSGDAAPPVARSRPARVVPSDKPVAAIRATGSGASLAELARAVSEQGTPESLSAVSDFVQREGLPDSSQPSVSSYAPAWLTRGRIWLLLVGLFMAVGYALARWRGLDLLLPP